VYKFKEPIVWFKKLHPEAIIPTYGHDDNSNAGVDLYSCEDIRIPAGLWQAVNTGVAWDPSDLTLYDNGCKVVMVVKSRSGLAFRNSIEASCAGVIDESYRGEIQVLLRNFTDVDYQIKKGDRIAQGLILYMPLIQLREATELSMTERADKGFGSSGV